MLNFIFAIVLLALALGAVSIRKTYYALPLAELKRRAANHDVLASRLYRAVAYEDSLRGLLWLFVAITSAAGFVLLARVTPVSLSLILVVALLWLAFSWLPASRVTSFGTRATDLVTPSLVWLLDHLHPLLSRSVTFFQKRYATPKHTGLFERDDLLALIERQQQQSDSRLSPEELDIIRHVLSFADFAVRDVLTPRSEIRTVHANDTVGPILIDELHQTGQSHVLVSDSTKAGHIVGSLEVATLGLQSTGHVRDLMDGTVYYVHENDGLSEALHAFFVTNHPLFVVINSFEEYVGVIGIQNILQQLIGHIPGDDFDQYADLQAVASRHPRKHKPKKADEDIIEVLE